MELDLAQLTTVILASLISFGFEGRIVDLDRMIKRIIKTSAATTVSLVVTCGLRIFIPINSYCWIAVWVASFWFAGTEKWRKVFFRIRKPLM